MNLQQHLQLKLVNVPLRDIAQIMGYPKFRRAQAAQRIHKAIYDPSLGLYSGSFDFRLSSREFLITLCEVLGINIDEHLDDIERIEAKHLFQRDSFKSYVFVDTNFKRNNQPIHALAICEGQRNLQLSYDNRVKPLHEQVRYVRELIKDHYIDNSGSLGIWGEIIKYIFHYHDDGAVELAPDGMVIRESDAIDQATTLTKGNADISKLINL